MQNLTAGKGTGPAIAIKSKFCILQKPPGKPMRRENHCTKVFESKKIQSTSWKELSARRTLYGWRRKLKTYNKHVLKEIIMVFRKISVRTHSPYRRGKGKSALLLLGGGGILSLKEGVIGGAWDFSPANWRGDCRALGRGGSDVPSFRRGHLGKGKGHDFAAEFLVTGSYGAETEGKKTASPLVKNRRPWSHVSQRGETVLLVAGGRRKLGSLVGGKGNLCLHQQREIVRLEKKKTYAGSLIRAPKITSFMGRL